MNNKLLRASLIILGFVSSGYAQESLLLGAGDLIHVKVFDTADMEQHPRITDAGTVPLLFVGDVKVGGLTPGEAAHAIEQTLIDKQYMLHPHVAVTVDEYGTQQASVMGQVKAPGAYDITAPTSIITVLSMAGGLSDLADRHITIQRRGKTGERVSYFLSNNSEQALSVDPMVYPGDSVLVPKASIVYVIGDVAHPGGYPVTTNDSKISVLQALALAGYANKTATVNKTRLVRKTANGQQDIQLQISAMQKGEAPDVLLSADDVLYVPFSWLKNMAISASQIAASTSSAAIYAVR